MEVESGTLHDLYSVAFSSDGKTVIASGDSGTVLVSEDFGWSWDVKGKRHAQGFEQDRIGREWRNRYRGGR